MKVIPGTRQADLFGFQSIYKIGMTYEGYSRNASSALNSISTFLFSLQILAYGKFEDTKVVIRSSKSDKDRQCNGQRLKGKQLSTKHYNVDIQHISPIKHNISDLRVHLL